MVGKHASRIPVRGDIITLSLDPTRGHEQRGMRPAVVVSEKEFNRVCGLALIVPITSKIKGYSNEVTVSTKHVRGSALTAQIRSIDWKNREIAVLDTCPRSALRAIQEMLVSYIAGDDA
ncbi:MAG: type II toxin-antitoxin system PemK/MazF family toxin [bacterium]|nr:type II toxin-antitoxin system PemK/MazF family toxin [bacterium]